ncbi:MAG: hypothetical protein V1788_00480 [Nanoarchaeota archaeon]
MFLHRSVYPQGGTRPQIADEGVENKWKEKPKLNLPYLTEVK